MLTQSTCLWWRPFCDVGLFSSPFLKGVTYHCDLLENGSIRWNGKLFQSAIDWLTQLKLTYNLAKSFPVWTNVRGMNPSHDTMALTTIASMQ